MNYLPLIIIGAPRSGTNMLRDVLCQLDGVATWPCDEINYIWRHGNVTAKTDEFDAEHATDDIKRFIRKEFDKEAYSNSDIKTKVLVEKTCANSLRVPFINAVMPEAKYVYIVRDGLDAVGSASHRWKASLDLRYIMKKVPYIPMTDIPYYAVRYFFNRLNRLFSKEKRLSFWGPSFEGLTDALEQYSLEEVCALQWQRCVEVAEKALADLPEEKVVRVSYESFVENPQKELNRLLISLGIEASTAQVSNATAVVTDKNVGKGRQALEPAITTRIISLIGETLQRYGYKV